MLIELSRLVKHSLFDVCRISAGILVEYLLINKSFHSNVLLPNKPPEAVIKQRMMQSFEGGYVKEPKPGLHENIAVLDFSSLHPTIMISHNISPDTVNCEHKTCKEKNSAPTKVHFCQKRKGFLSSILEELFNKRIALKKELKKLKDKKSMEYKLLDARQHALKIVLNYSAIKIARPQLIYPY